MKTIAEKAIIIGGSKMETKAAGPEVLTYQFVGKDNRAVEVWAVYFNERLVSLSFACAPYFQMENVGFGVMPS